MKKTKNFLSSVHDWLLRSHKNFLIAAVAATAVVFAVSTYAATPSATPKAANGCPASVASWAEKLGWEDPKTYACKVDLSKHSNDAQPGSVAAGEFRSVKEMTKFMNGNSAKAKAFRKAAQQILSPSEYKAWKSGKNFVPVQFKKAAIIDTNSHLVNGRVAYTNNANRHVKAGDIIFVFVYKNKVVPNGNVRMDCGNPRIVKIRPKDKQKKPKGNIEIIKFLDLNGNGKLDKGETRMADVTFTVTDNGDKKTDKKGRIRVDGIAPGKYVATEQVPEGYEPTTKTAQTANVKDRKTVSLYFGNKPVEIEKKETPPPPPCVEPGTLKITGYVDANKNGQRDANEQPKVGTRFTVKAPSGEQQETVTDANGVATVTGLNPETYSVEEDTPAGMVAVQKVQNATIVNCQQAELVFVNQPVEKEVCTTPGTLKITGYIDTNKNGQRDANEQPKVGTRFNVKAASGEGQDVTTDATGTANVSNLQPGSYTVEEDTPTGMTADKKVQTVTIENCKAAELLFVNKPVPPADEKEIPVIEEKRPVATQVKGMLPETGTPTELALLAFVLLSGSYYGYRYFHNRSK